MRPMFPMFPVVIAFFAGSALVGQVAFAEEHACATGAVGWVPPSVLIRPVTLHRGLGPVYEQVTTASPPAQAFYLQGLAYLHSFVWIEAAPAQTGKAQ